MEYKSDTYRPVLKAITDTASRILPKNTRVLLFGSRARGDANSNSDWDLMIILDKKKRDIDDIDNYACPFMELGYTINEEINPIIYTKEEWNKRHATMFHHIVEKEGIELCR